MVKAEQIQQVGIYGLVFPLRANISFTLSHDVREEVLKLNSIIVRDGFSEIDFSGPSAPIPHITLLMGEVDSADDLKALIEALQYFGQHHEPISYEIGRPYLRRPSRNFIFVDTLPQSEFRLFRLELHQILSKFIDCDLHGGPKNISHITLGYAHGVYPGIDNLIQVARPAKGIADTFQIAKTGQRGTCLGAIATVGKDPNY